MAPVRAAARSAIDFDRDDGADPLEPSVSQAADKTAETTAQIPKLEADAAVAKQVAAGTVGGITPQQQVTNKDAAARLAVEQARLKVEQDKAKAATDAKAKGKPLSAMEADKISEIDKGLSAIRDLRESIATGKVGGLARAEAAIVPNAMADLRARRQPRPRRPTSCEPTSGRPYHGGVMRNDTEAAGQYTAAGDSKSLIASKLNAVEKMGWVAPIISAT